MPSLHCHAVSSPNATGTFLAGAARSVEGGSASGGLSNGSAAAAGAQEAADTAPENGAGAGHAPGRASSVCSGCLCSGFRLLPSCPAHTTRMPGQRRAARVSAVLLSSQLRLCEEAPLWHVSVARQQPVTRLFGEGLSEQVP